MSGTDTRSVVAFSPVGTAGLDETWQLVLTDLDGDPLDFDELSVWFGGTLTDVDDFTDATEYSADVDDNVATVVVSIPTIRLQACRITVDGVVKTVGNVIPDPGGTDTFDGSTINLVAGPIVINLSVAGTFVSTGGGTVTSVAGVDPDIHGDVPLTPADIGAATSSALAAVASDVSDLQDNDELLEAADTALDGRLDTAEAKLAGIEVGATADQTAAEILTAIKTVDGTGSGLDADLLDGISSAGFATAAQGAAADAAKTKTDWLTVTQAVDLDAIETRVNELDAAVILKGVWDASAGTFPGAGAAQAGWSYIVSVAGTVGGTAFAVNDRIIAIVDNASTSTFAANWFKADYTDQVLSVDGQTGAVVLSGTYAAVDGGALSVGGTPLTEAVFPSTLARDTEVTSAISTHAGATDPHGDRAYASSLFAANDAMLYKGVIDCSSNPNYPAADAGHTYRISVAGKIGGASGVSVEAGDMAICVVDGSSAGTQAAVGANWDVVQTNHGVLATVATTGAYSDLSGKPVIGTDVQAWDADLDALAARWTTATTTNPSQLAFREGTNNGTNEVVVKGVANLSADKTLTLPGRTGTVIASPDTPAQGDVLYFDGTDWKSLAAGTSGYFLKTQGASANPAWAAVSTTEPPWLLTIDPTTQATISSKVGTYVSSGLAGGSYPMVEMYNSTHAQNDELVWNIVLGAGTWTVGLLHKTGNNLGIITVSLDDGAGSFTSLGTIDCYSAGTVTGVSDSITGVSVGSTIKRQLRLKVATKNASSSDYYMVLAQNGITLRRTA